MRRPMLTEIPLFTPMTFSYRNWRGQKDKRRVKPIRVWFGSTQWHPDPQWFLEAEDVDKSEVRDFAFVDMSFDGPSAISPETVTKS